MARTRPLAVSRLAIVAAGLALGSLLVVGSGQAEEASPDLDRSAAADGDAAALVRLASRYETGDAVPFDLDHAAALLEQAAMRGDVTAQYRFGLMQAGGVGSEDKLVDAYGWLLLAEKASPERPDALLGDAVGEAISTRLEEAEVEAAEAWAAAFEPVTGPVDLSVLLGEAETRVELAKLEQDLSDVGCGSPVRPDDETRMLAYASAGVIDDASGLGEMRDNLADHGIALDVTELSPPLCDLRALLTVAPDRLIESGVELADVAPGPEPVLQEGDRLVVDIAAADADRYVAVDYVVHTGDVLHLHPAGDDEGRLAADQTLRLGDGSNGRQPWQVGAPFGRDLLVVTISKKAPPSDRAGRSMVEPLGPYLAGWRARIDSSDADDSWQVFERVILTKAR